MNKLTDFSKLRDGDMVFIQSHSANAPYITAVTGSKLTHCGLIFRQGAAAKVYEGAGRGTHLSVEDWQHTESGDHPLEPLYARRLKQTASTLTADKIQALKAEAAKLHDTHYDFGFAWSNTYNDETTHAAKEYVYCSELLYKAYDRALGIKIGTPHPLKGYYEKLSAEQAAAMIHKLNSDERSRKCRGGKDFDPNDLAISPEEVFDSELLEDVI